MYWDKKTAPVKDRNSLQGRNHFLISPSAGALETIQVTECFFL